MDKNTVIISTEEYNRLRDFKNEITKGRIYTIIDAYGANRTVFWTKEEIIDNYEKIREEEFNRIKNMSYWEFRKWRKSNE